MLGANGTTGSRALTLGNHPKRVDSFLFEIEVLRKKNPTRKDRMWGLVFDPHFANYIFISLS